mgnify:CR=1 FL=1
MLKDKIKEETCKDGRFVTKSSKVFRIWTDHKKNSDPHFIGKKDIVPCTEKTIITVIYTNC